MPNMIKKVQQMRTMLPIGFKLERSVCTTNLRPGALTAELAKMYFMERAVWSPIDYSQGPESSDKPENPKHSKYLALLPNYCCDCGIW